ncbi:DUF3817 domain-containing protein [Nocardioidaceae bacterium]|nr:DUF3817 domain-containing protein [Nocardioidaceae bacterium]
MSHSTAEVGTDRAAPAPRRLFRVVAVTEAVTWTLLLVGMYLKYVSETTDAVVSVGGMLHGIAFIAFVVTTVAVAIDARWGLRRTVLVLASSIPPLVTVPVDLVLERRGALPERWRLRTEAPTTRLDRLLAPGVRHPGRGLLVGVAGVAVLTGVALLVGPPVG